MPDEDHYADRYHAHKKWSNRHLFMAGISMMTIVGLLWAWLPAIKWWQHRRAAKQAKQQVDGPLI